MTPPQDFYPQKLVSWLVRAVQWCAPTIARWVYWVEIRVNREQLHHLDRLDGDRVLLLPNHPTFHDPIVMFLLSAQVKRAFYYMAAFETFDDPSTMFLISAGFKPIHRLAKSKRFKQLLRWMLQHLGMYSIRRGLADRASIAQTLKLLAEPNCDLVIFPEGGCSFQNDTVMPFRVGAIQMAFQALNRQAKHDEPIPNLYVIPISIKYRYTDDMQPVIERSLRQLEHQLAITPELPQRPYDRLRAIAEAVLVRIERDYGLTTSTTDADSLNDRIQTLRLHVIQSCEQQLSLTPPPDEFIRERVYKIQHLLHTQADTLDQNLRWSLNQVERAMRRLLNFDAIYDGYVADSPTPERFIDTLIRLEREVFDIDQPPPKGYRIATLCLGTPTNLKDRFADYQRDRTTTVDGVVSQVHEMVQTNLDHLTSSH